MMVSNSGGDFKPIPEGTYTAICVRVIDLGTQVTTFKGADKTQRKVLLAWEIPEVEVEYDGEIRPALIMSRYTASLHEKANLRKHLESWRGRRFTEDELRGFDVANVLGKPCLMQVLHSESNGTIYSNVAAVMAMPKGTVAPRPYHDLIDLDLDVGAFNPDVYDKLTPKLQETIAQSPEYKLATGTLKPGEPATNGHDFSADMDDEIPF